MLPNIIANLVGLKLMLCLLLHISSVFALANIAALTFLSKIQDKALFHCRSLGHFLGGTNV